MSRPLGVCRLTAHRAVATEGNARAFQISRARICRSHGAVRRRDLLATGKPTAHYSRLGVTSFLDAGTTMAFFTGRTLETGSTVHIQPRWPFLSKYQVPPPRFTISTRQWSLFAGIATKNVSAAAIVTPQSIPIRNMRMNLKFFTYAVIGARRYIGLAACDLAQTPLYRLAR